MSQPFRDQTNRSAPSSPQSRLCRKLGDLSVVKTPSSASRRTNLSLFGSKTPNQILNQSIVPKGKGLTKRDITPSRNKAFTGTTGGGDRFVPTRSQSQFEFANYLMSKPVDSTFNTSSSAPNSPTRPEREQHMRMMRVNSESDLQSTVDERIFVYRKHRPPLPPAGHINHAKVMYSTTAMPSSSVKKASRHIPTAPERILDAPGILDDYYTSLLDWSSTGIVAVALTYEVYLWNSESGETFLLVTLPDDNSLNVITSVKWGGDGKYLAVSTMDGAIRLYDPSRSEGPELRKMAAARVSRAAVLSWRQAVVSSGHRSGQIVHHDVRIAQHCIGIASGHSQEVCGLRWSPDGRHLGSGGGDNVVNIWDQASISTNTDTPTHSLSEHSGSVRALSWCPWKQSMLATGGGLADHSLKLWDVTGGKLLKTHDTGSQVTDIVFNSDYKEIMTSHGHPKYELKIWKYPSFSELATLGGHTARVMNLSMSPCGEYVISASSDETLRVWHCFKIDKSTARLAARKALNASIR